MMKFSKIALGSLAMAGSFFLAAPASAEDLGVSATVESSCVIVTAPVAFGNYDPMVAHLTTALEGQGSLTVSCTEGSEGVIILDQGSNAAAGSSDAAPLRQMAFGTDALAYQLYSDVGRTAVWGNTELTGVEYTGTGSATSAIAVYGRVAGGQNVPVGDYVDTVEATVTF